MNKNKELKPICVLDTGVGGLSVVNALRKLANKEQIYYFADTANLPYGYKSPDLIKKLAKNIITTALTNSDCKLLVIACHTITVVCQKELEELQKEFKIPIITMLKPSIVGLEKIILDNNLTSLSIVSTKATFDSQAYKKGLSHLPIKLYEKAVSSLVSLVEENCFDESQLITILDNMLPKDIKNSDALLLGCTHFSALKNIFKTICKENCLIIDAANLVAQEVMQSLESLNLLSKYPTMLSPKAFVSDNPQRFSQAAKQFIHDDFDIRSI